MNIVRTPHPFSRRRDALSKAPLLRLAQEQLDGIANATYNLAESLTWETASDWDNAVSEAGVVHETSADRDVPGDAIIRPGYPSVGTNKQGHYPLDEDSGSTAFDVSGNNRDGSITGATVGQTGLFNTDAHLYDGADDYTDCGANFQYSSSDPFTINFWALWDGTNESNNSRACGFDTSNGNGYGFLRDQFSANDNSMAFRTDSNTYNYPTGMVSGTWYMYSLVNDGAGDQALYEDGSQAKTVSQSFGTPSETFHIGTVGRDGGAYLSEPWAGRLDAVQIWNEAKSSSFISDLWAAATGATLTTATKSFSTAQTPNLSGLSYSLNGTGTGTGNGIDLDVIGSPGTASEEVVTQSLDGATSYSLTWSNSHQDFRIRPNMYPTANYETAPTFSAATVDV